jgi:hypothetical protein
MLLLPLTLQTRSVPLTESLRAVGRDSWYWEGCHALELAVSATYDAALHIMIT